MAAFVVALAGFAAVAGLALWRGRGRGRALSRGRRVEGEAPSDARLEAEDLAQMLAAHNARRRRRGQAPQSASDIERQLEREWDDLTRARRPRDGEAPAGG